MSENNFKDSMDRRLQSVVLRPELRQSILEQCQPSARPERARCIPWRRVVRQTVAVAAAAAVIVLSGVVGVAANPPLRRSLDKLGDDLVSLLQPVNLADEDNGIRMEVLAAMNDEDVAVVYLTLQDTEKKNRLDETVQLRDLCVRADGTILDGEELFNQAEVLWYDEETQTATIQLRSQSASKIAGKKISLLLHSFLSGEEREEMVDSGYTLEDVARANAHPALLYPSDVEQYSAWGARMEDLTELIDTQAMPVLMENGLPLTFEEYPWVSVSNAAVVDNMLHVQLNYDPETGLYNECSVVLGDKEGHRFDVSGANISLGTVVREGRSSYTTREEQIALVPGEALFKDVHIYGDLVSYAHQQSGQWQTTFRLRPANDTLSAACDIDMNPWKVSQITVSPIGVTVHGEGEMYAYSDSIELEVFLKDGSAMEVDSVTTTSDGETIQCKSIFSRPAKMEEIDHVKLNGHIIRFDN
ncbi:MAG TPA: hypothetical protein H9985_05340 [Candidatus Anaerofilum faecale]|nr:hypothetical protein [Candidatus Anaerofilum faecale]